MARKSYEKRLEDCKNPLVAKLFKIILEKKTNLCLAADRLSTETILRLVDKVGKYICILKVHGEYRETNFHEQLAAKKREHNFLLFEDRKFEDDDNAVEDIFSRIVQHVDLVTVYNCFKGIEDAVKKANLPPEEPRGALAVCEVSFRTGLLPLMSYEDSSRLLESAEKSDICAGIIAQHLNLSDDCSMFKASPGVHIARESDGRSQNWRHPSVLIEEGTDVIIVGRGITSVKEDEWEETALLYRDASWNAYLKQDFNGNLRVTGDR